MQRNISSLVTGKNLEQLYQKINLQSAKRLALENRIPIAEVLLNGNMVDDDEKEDLIIEIKKIIILAEELIAKRNNITNTYKEIKEDVEKRINELNNATSQNNEMTENWLHENKIKLEEDFKIYLVNTESYLLNMINAAITYLLSLDKKEIILDPLVSGSAAISDHPENSKIHSKLKSTIEEFIRRILDVKTEHIDILFKVLTRDKIKNELAQGQDQEQISRYIANYEKQFSKNNFLLNFFLCRMARSRSIIDPYTNKRLDLYPGLIKLYKKHEARKDLFQYQHKFNIISACLSYLFCLDEDKSIFREKSNQIDMLFIEDKEINKIYEYKNVLIENNKKTKTCLLYEQTKQLFNEDNTYRKGKLDLFLLINEPIVVNRISY